MKISRKTVAAYAFLVIFTYGFGLITVQYKLFPFEEIRKAKKFIVGEASVKASVKDKSKYQITGEFRENSGYIHKTSFFAEHSKNVEITMVGDSITDSGEWGDLFPSKLIADQGIGGDTTTGVLNRMDLIYRTNASKVFIMLGVNDFFAGKNVDDTYYNYRRIIDKLTENNIKVYVQSTLLLSNKRKHLNNRIIQLNSMLENYAQSSELITYIDLNSQLTDGYYLSDEYSSDGLHLNGKGFVVWKEIIEPYIM